MAIEGAVSWKSDASQMVGGILAFFWVRYQATLISVAKFLEFVSMVLSLNLTKKAGHQVQPPSR
jgi:hypothetical protein